MQYHQYFSTFISIYELILKVYNLVLGELCFFPAGVWSVL